MEFLKPIFEGNALTFEQLCEALKSSKDIKLGINGDAYISERAVHLDNGGRTTVYRGDERYGNNSIAGRDFYKYFGKKKNEVYTMLRPKVSVWDIKGNKIRVGKDNWINFEDLR